MGMIALNGEKLAAGIACRNLGQLAPPECAWVPQITSNTFQPLGCKGRSLGEKERRFCVRASCEVCEMGETGLEIPVS